MGFTIIINDINIIAYGFNKNNCNMYIFSSNNRIDYYSILYSY